jgi:glc operon protein GlcG
VSITLEQANTIIARALEQAAQQGLRVAVVVLDGGGHLLAAQRMDGAYLTAVNVAQKKAFTAVNFRVSTVALRERLPEIDYQIQLQVTDDRLALFPGGAPLLRGDEVIGALGISGASAAQDAEICTAALGS